MANFSFELGTPQFILPIVIPDYLSQISVWEAALKTAATANQFYYTTAVPKYDRFDQIPDVVYDIADHFTRRGFLCTYDGDAGNLTIAWDHPNMSSLDVEDITVATPAMITNLGYAFTAALLYLCLTNGNDLRQFSEIAVRRQIQQSIDQAAVLGNTNVTFGFPGVPAATIISLYQTIFNDLNTNGFGVSYSSGMGAFIIAWDAGMTFNLVSGEMASAPGLS